jgi:hypothetical protein
MKNVIIISCKTSKHDDQNWISFAIGRNSSKTPAGTREYALLQANLYLLFPTAKYLVRLSKCGQALLSHSNGKIN